jgi:hypothetical protein
VRSPSLLSTSGGDSALGLRRLNVTLATISHGTLGTWVNTPPGESTACGVPVSSGITSMTTSLSDGRFPRRPERSRHPRIRPTERRSRHDFAGGPASAPAALGPAQRDVCIVCVWLG